MKEQQKFFICEICGNIVGLIENAGIPMECCGEEMAELIPNTVDASYEKHVPVIKSDGNTATIEIGSDPHPMTEEHHIGWVYIQTEKGGQRKSFKPNDIPSVKFTFVDDKPLAAFAYCNLHGLWMTKFD